MPKWPLSSPAAIGFWDSNRARRLQTFTIIVIDHSGNYRYITVALSDRKIYISRGGEKYGPYPEANAKEMLAVGQLQPTDMAWYAGADEWKPLTDLFEADSPPSVPAEPATADQSDPPDEEPDDPDKIHVTRRGEPIGPYSRDKAREYFIAGQLLPTDWGWHDGMGEDWRPLNEVLGLPTTDQNGFNSAMTPQWGSGKGKKIAMIAGVSVLMTGLITAGILFGLKLLGGGKIETADDLAKATVEALKDEDQDALENLTIINLSKSEMKALAMEHLKEENIAPLAKLKGQSASELIEKMKKEIDETFENGWEEMDELRKDMQLTLALKMFDLRTDAYNSGLDDWSDVTVKSVDDSKMRAPMPGSDKREGSESVPKIGTLEVTVTSKGADYRILIRAHYSPSGGWYLRSPPRWADP